MARAFDDWTPVKIAVDDDRARAACIEVPAEMVGGATLGSAVILRHDRTGVAVLAGIRAAGRAPGETATYVSTKIHTAVDPKGNPLEPTPARIRRVRWTDDLVLREGLAATVSRELLGAAALVLAAIAAFTVTKVPQALAVALLAAGILAALVKAIHEIRRQLRFDC